MGRGKGTGGPRGSRRHAPSPVALVFGILFCGIALGWLLLTQHVVTLGDLHWALPGLLTGAGVVGILASLGRGRSERD